MTAARFRDVLAPALRGIEGAVCDSDGVISDSAKAHAAAWKTAFDTFLAEHPPDDPVQRRPFDSGDGAGSPAGGAAGLGSAGAPDTVRAR